MKTKFLALVLALAGLGLPAQTPPAAPGAAPVPISPANRRLPARFAPTSAPAAPPVLPSAMTAPAAAPEPTTNAAPEEMIPAGTINFQGVDVNQVLDIYAQLVNRTLLRAGLPAAQIVLKTQTPLTKSEAIQALQAVLALNGIAVVNIGDKFVKVLAVGDANSAGAELDQSGSTNLPAMGSYVTHITQLHYVKPSVMIPLIQPFGKLQGGLLGIDDNGILVMRDYAENVKRMLEMIDKIDVSVPAEYVSEVIPIRYAKVDDIASALNALGGSGGGATVSIGSGTANAPISGLRSSGLSGAGGAGGAAFGGIGGNNPYQSGGVSAFGQTRTPTAVGGVNGTPTGGTSFAQRLNSIIQRASGAPGQQDQIQLFGQTKIIPNESSSSLLIFATRDDLAMIKEIIAKLDVPLAQVLIEAIIMDVTLGNTFDLGVSVAQNPKQFTGSKSSPIVGGGGMNNSSGSPFQNFLSQATNGIFSLGTNASSVFGNILTPKAFSYFGNIGPLWDVAVNAAESDKNNHIIQRPRIQTSQAQPAQFFVGSTVPYQTGSYNYGNGNQVSFAQLSVGVELDVTPFINPEGAVTMQIQQEIDDISEKPSSDNNFQPSTDKRTLNTTITVRDKDTVMLGGFIRSDNNHSQSGVPFLQDIPLLGNLFKSRSDSKDRSELIVLMRPTVLGTPKLAAENTIKEAQRLPGVSAAAVEDAAYERSLINAERKKELKNAKDGNSSDGFFNMRMEETNAPVATNAPALDSDSTAAPDDSQQKARAALERKLNEMDKTPPAAQP
jgi:general secretion pathway protein D